MKIILLYFKYFYYNYNIKQKVEADNGDAKYIINEFVSEFIDEYLLRRYARPNKLNENLINFLRKFCNFICITSKGLEYLTYEDIIKIDKELVEIKGFYGFLDYLNEILDDLLKLTENKLILSPNYDINRFADYIFDFRINIVNPLSLIIKKVYDLNGIIPKTWKVIKFGDIKTSRLFLDKWGSFLNVNNNFIDLLSKNKSVITEERRITLDGFFRTLKMYAKRNKFDLIEKNQKKILQWYVEANIINLDDVENYILKKDDFPQYLT